MKINDFLVISYYTKNTGYELEVQNLIESLEQFDIPYYIEDIESLGSWQKNTQYKVEFIQKCFEEFNQPLVFLDADAVVDEYPVLFESIEEDIGVHYRYLNEDCSKLLSGTVYLKHRPIIKQLLKEWNRFNIEYNKELEQTNLNRAIEYMKQVGLTVNKLPASYCNIFDLMDVKKPVISHYQASRKFK